MDLKKMVLRVFVKENIEFFELIDISSNELISSISQPLGTALINFYYLNLTEIKTSMNGSITTNLAALYKVYEYKQAVKTLDKEALSRSYSQKNIEKYRNTDTQELKEHLFHTSSKWITSHIFLSPLTISMIDMLDKYFRLNSNIANYNFFLNKINEIDTSYAITNLFVTQYLDIEYNSDLSEREKFMCFINAVNEKNLFHSKEYKMNYSVDTLEYFPEAKYDSISFKNSKEQLYEVIFPKTLSQLINFIIAKSIQNKVKIRLCGNCCKYFVLTKQLTGRYCNRPIENSTKTCKEYAANKKYLQRKLLNPIEKAYSRAYKTNYSRIKYNTITKENFNIWAKQARNYRDKCKSNQITFAEYELWLNNSSKELIFHQ